MQILNAKELAAIELKYLGNTFKEISNKIEVPVKTIEGWFVSTTGKLLPRYNQFAEEMNNKRLENFEKNISLRDDEIFILTTNTTRLYGKLLKEGKITPTFLDVFRSWEMQRIMRGLPTTYQRQEVTEKEIEEDRIIKELNLTDEDFTEEKRNTTLIRIADYLKDRQT
jgi:hypothetical protein